MLVQNFKVQLIWPPSVVGCGFAGFVDKWTFCFCAHDFSFGVIRLISYCSIGIEFDKKPHGR
jgi:diadenosine tetraphosphatase ApaH/serine/threonine PP2A family protein phosphatase